MRAPTDIADFGEVLKRASRSSLLGGDFVDRLSAGI
jgi:hypothetical protein